MDGTQRMSCPICRGHGYTGHAGDTDPRRCEYCADWRQFAACQGNLNLMFDDRKERQAKRICDTCPVTRECFTEAMTLTRISMYHAPHGVWAGTNRRERISYLRRHRAK